MWAWWRWRVLGAGPEWLTREGDRTGLWEWHALLLRLAGSLPDDLICEARAWLADGGLVDVAQAIGFAAVTGRVPVLAQDAELMAAQLLAAGQDTELIDSLERLEEPADRHRSWIFSSTDPAIPGAFRGPST